MIVHGEAHRLPLADGIAQCCVTSPPYWGLRKYNIRDTTFADGWTGQLGCEAEPGLYVKHMVEVCSEVQRVLKDDGVLFLNLGDSYVNKNLVGIPWRVAFALQSDGWWLRSDIVWSKQNPMPEHVTDRPTRAHEYVFLLSKSPRYFWNANAVREPYTKSALARFSYKQNKIGKGLNLPGGASHAKGVSHEEQLTPNPAGRHLRDVWTIATQSYDGAHFATMPEALASRCILAATTLTNNTVLDPFHGSGTVGRVAESLGRDWIGVDLGYHNLAKQRTHITRGLPL